MNFYERLEALAHSLELMAGMQMQVTERQDIALASFGRATKIRNGLYVGRFG
jgi:hypothetical protein